MTPAPVYRQRVEPCVCGGVIRAGSSDRNVIEMVRAHNGSLLHLRWRWSHGIETPPLDGMTPSDDPRRRWPTADDSDVDLSVDGVGASASDAEGAA